MMRAEHRALDDLLETAKSETDTAALKSTIGELLDLAHDHFRKEEMVLFPMARQCFDEAALSELGDQWAVCRNVTVDR